MGRDSKARSDPMGAHARLYHSVLDSPAWRALSWFDQALYMLMRRKLTGTNNGNIEATLTGLKHYGVTSSASLAKGLRALQAVGLIEKTRDTVGVEYGSKVCCLYRFTDQATFELPAKNIEAMPATKDWLQFKSIAQAAAAIKSAGEASKAKGCKNREKKKTTPQETNRLSSKTEAMAPGIGSGNEQALVGSLRKPKRVRKPSHQDRTKENTSLSAQETGDVEIHLTTSIFEHLCMLPGYGSKSGEEQHV